MTILNYAAEITTIQRDCIVHWKEAGIHFHQEHFLKIVEENHAFNYQLWHAEDRARRDDKGFEFIYRAKRDIDHYNQQRNNRMEAMDAWIWQHLQPAAPSACPVHSETPGMMIDRLSIMALKEYHMAIQASRTDVDGKHRKACSDKLHTIHAQLRQLQDCLHQLIQEVHNKTRTFCVYHQFKMYNDPTLNPELYNQDQRCS